MIYFYFFKGPREGSGPNFKNKAFKVVLLSKAPPHFASMNLVNYNL